MQEANSSAGATFAQTEATKRAPALVLEYGHSSRAERFRARLRLEHLTVVVAGGTIVLCYEIRNVPLWVAVVTSAILSLLWWLYARERSSCRRSAYWLITDQLLAATVMSAEGMFLTLNRASRISHPGVWLPYNQTYMLNPTWALEPLWHTAMGVAWFAVGLLVIRLRQRSAPATACSA